MALAVSDSIRDRSSWVGQTWRRLRWVVVPGLLLIGVGLAGAGPLVSCIKVLPSDESGRQPRVGGVSQGFEVEPEPFWEVEPGQEVSILADGSDSGWDIVEAEGGGADGDWDAEAEAALSEVEEVDACVAQCEGKQCGPDGCNGECGLCPDSKPICKLGLCKKCSQSCEDKECGSDGCGGLCGVCPAAFSCNDGLCLAPTCSDTEILFEEGFDSCSQGAFEIVDYQPGDSVTWWGLSVQPASPPCSLYLGDPLVMTYFTGSSVHVELISDKIVLPPLDGHKLSFQLKMETEPVPAPQYPYDHDVLYVTAIGQGFDDVLFSSKVLLNTTQGEFLPIVADLSQRAGEEIQLVFRFDTVDSIANQYVGVFLDDVLVDAICPYCMDDSDCSDADPCNLEYCHKFSNFPQVGTCLVEAIDQCCHDQPEGFCDDGDPCSLDGCDPDSGQCVHEPSEDPECEDS